MSQRPSTHEGRMGFDDQQFSHNLSGFTALRPMTNGGFQYMEGRATSPVYKFQGGHGTYFSKSNIPKQKVFAPPVGTYNLTRFVDNNYENKKDPRVMKRHLSASFNSSGRSKGLLTPYHHLTMSNEMKHSNLGPGSYDITDTWASEERQSVNLVTTRQLRCLSPSLQRHAEATMNDSRPWRTSPYTTAPTQAAVHAPPHSKSQHNGQRNLEKEDSKAILKDIEAVRQLPEYR